jgi:hypothetical protein
MNTVHLGPSLGRKSGTSALGPALLWALHIEIASLFRQSEAKCPRSKDVTSSTGLIKLIVITKQRSENFILIITIYLFIYYYLYMDWMGLHRLTAPRILHVHTSCANLWYTYMLIWPIHTFVGILSTVHSRLIVSTHSVRSI